jgi:hypothetical protein
MTVGWRKWKNKEMLSLYFSMYYRMIKSSMIRRAKHVVSMGKTRNAYNILVGISERRSPLGRPRHRSEDNIENN